MSDVDFFATDGGLETAVRVLGGCCGTDARHVAAVVAAWNGAKLLA